MTIIMNLFFYEQNIIYDRHECCLPWTELQLCKLKAFHKANIFLYGCTIHKWLEVFFSQFWMRVLVWLHWINKRANYTLKTLKQFVISQSNKHNSNKKIWNDEHGKAWATVWKNIRISDNPWPMRILKSKGYRG